MKKRTKPLPIQVQKFINRHNNILKDIHARFLGQGLEVVSCYVGKYIKEEGRTDLEKWISTVRNKELGPILIEEINKINSDYVCKLESDIESRQELSHATAVGDGENNFHKTLRFLDMAMFDFAHQADGKTQLKELKNARHNLIQALKKSSIEKFQLEPYNIGGVEPIKSIKDLCPQDILTDDNKKEPTTELDEKTKCYKKQQLEKILKTCRDNLNKFKTCYKAKHKNIKELNLIVSAVNADIESAGKLSEEIGTNIIEKSPYSKEIDDIKESNSRNVILLATYKEEIEAKAKKEEINKQLAEYRKQIKEKISDLSKSTNGFEFKMGEISLEKAQARAAQFKAAQKEIEEIISRASELSGTNIRNSYHKGLHRIEVYSSLIATHITVLSKYEARKEKTNSQTHNSHNKTTSRKDADIPNLHDKQNPEIVKQAPPLVEKNAIKQPQQEPGRSDVAKLLPKEAENGAQVTLYSKKDDKLEVRDPYYCYIDKAMETFIRYDIEFLECSKHAGELPTRSQIKKVRKALDKAVSYIFKLSEQVEEKLSCLKKNANKSSAMLELQFCSDKILSIYCVPILHDAMMFYGRYPRDDKNNSSEDPTDSFNTGFPEIPETSGDFLEKINFYKKNISSAIRKSEEFVRKYHEAFDENNLSAARTKISPVIKYSMYLMRLLDKHIMQFCTKEELNITSKKTKVFNLLYTKASKVFESVLICVKELSIKQFESASPQQDLLTHKEIPSKESTSDNGLGSCGTEHVTKLGEVDPDPYL